MIKKCSLLLLTVVLLMGASSFAEELYPVPVETTIYTGSQRLYFFSALFTGVIIAVALHAVLTTLSVALGVSVIKPENAIAPHHDREKNHQQQSDSESKGVASVVHTLNNAFGLWALIVASVSLFLASWAGVELSESGSLWIGAIIALAIWGVSYLLLLAMEARMMSSAFGALYHTATGGMQTVGKGLGAIFSKSPAHQAADFAGEITASVREELFGDLNTKKLHKQIDKYIRQLSPPSARQIKEELMDLLDKTELDAVIRTDDYGNHDFSHLQATLEEGGMTKEKAHHAVSSLTHAVKMIRQEYKTKDKLTTAADVAMEMTGRSHEQAEEIREKFENYLRNTNKEALNPEGIKQDVEKLFSSPREGLAALKHRLGSIDKETVTAVLEQRSDITHQEAEKIVDHVEHILHSIQSQVTGIRDSVSGTAQESQSQLEQKLAGYLNSLGNPDLQYKDLKEDFMLLFHDPKAGADQLLNRLKSFDRDTLEAIIASSSKKISPEDAEHMLDRIESVRDEAIAKAKQMKHRVEEEIDKARQKTANAVEETRKTAAVAAWWALACAVFSAAAAVAGGILATAI